MAVAPASESKALEVPGASQRRTSDTPATLAAVPAGTEDKLGKSAQEESTTVKPADAKVRGTRCCQQVADNRADRPVPNVVDQFRQFMDGERDKVQAKKQSIVKSEREKIIADFKNFQTTFKVCQALNLPA